MRVNRQKSWFCGPFSAMDFSRVCQILPNNNKDNYFLKTKQKTNNTEQSQACAATSYIHHSSDIPEKLYAHGWRCTHEVLLSYWTLQVPPSGFWTSRYEEREHNPSSLLSGTRRGYCRTIMTLHENSAAHVLGCVFTHSHSLADVSNLWLNFCCACSRKMCIKSSCSFTTRPS